MKKILAVSALLLSIGSTSAQEIVFPTLEEMAGDYIIINDKDYDGTKFIADMRDMRIIVNSDNSLTFSGYYMRGCLDLEAGYSEDSGNLSYDAGQKIFGIDGEGGVVQYLYGWDDKNQIPTERPITYRYKGNNTWRAESSIVLMSGVEGGELSPYYFSQGSSIYRSNAISHNISYVGLGSEQEMYDETRPSYIQLGTNNSITIYNLLTKDQFGYGCKLEGTYDPETGKVLFKPEVIGQTNDFIYKVLSGCTYDENEMKPTGTSYTDDFTHAGYVDAMIDFQNKRLEIGPMTIWPADVINNQLKINTDSYFEFIHKVTVNFEELGTTTSPQILNNDEVKTPINTEYFDLNGKRVHALEQRSGKLLIRRTTYSDGTTSAVKEFKTK